MSELAESMLFASDGFFLLRRRVFANISKNSLFGLYEISQKKLDFGQVRAVSQRVRVAAFCASK